MNAVDAFLDECRADTRYAADAPTIAEALEALYLEGDDSADAIAVMDAVAWVLKQQRSPRSAEAASRPIRRSPATLPTSPIDRAIQHHRARGGLNVDQPQHWVASGHLPHVHSGQCPPPRA